MGRRVQNIAIVGSGPAGSTLAALLAMRGTNVVIFDDGRRPDLIVGESLIPSIIPVLRRLGIEERVAAIGLYKPGVTFVMQADETIDFCFQSVKGCDLPTYAYNVPRPAFDRVLDERAAELGAVFVKARAKVERDGDRLRLSDESLALAPSFKNKQPDLIVDATGRSRMFARLLEIPATLGPRRDVAYFAHYENFAEEEPRGQVIIHRLATGGWSWRIPLRDCVSVGVVMNKDDAALLGATPEERLEAAITRDPVLARAGENRRRVSELAIYTNYQLVSERGTGPGWAMIGDAFGFVDPMLSPGLWLALHSAEILADNLENLGSYERQMQRHIAAWMELISYYYDGRMFAMYHTGVAMERQYDNVITRFLHRYFDQHIACMACGKTTISGYARGVIKFMAHHGIKGFDPADLAIR